MLIIILFFKVIGNGELLEFDVPNVLLSDPNSHFTLLVEQTGRAEAEHLRKLAAVAAYSKSLRVNHQKSDSDYPLSEDSGESDPLFSSDKKMQ